jgi:CheY-like chemotaxis protein
MPNILIVDDDANVAKSIMRLLQGHGFKVLTATNGREALAMLKKEVDVSVVIADQRMPVITGAEFFSRMKQSYPSIMRILLTSYTEMDELRTVINQGSVFRLLLKPWDDSELISCVEDGCNDYRLRQENEALNKQLTESNIHLARAIEQKSRVLSMNIKSLERYEQIVEQLPIGIICLSEDGMVMLANHQFRHDFGFSSAIEGMHYDRVLPASIHAIAVTPIANYGHEYFVCDGNTLEVTYNPLHIEKSIFGKVISIRSQAL